MIHIFRKLRQQFFRDKKMSKYLAYAIGEILLVVIGIILALQLSNWNLKKTEIKKEIWYLDNIANDMFNQQEDLKGIKDYYTEAISISKNLLLDFKTNMSFEDIDNLSYKLNRLMISNPFPNIDNTYKELVSSGQVALIENDSLTLDIIDFYIYNEKLEHIFKVTQDKIFYSEIYTVLNKYTAIDVSDYVENQDLVFEDTEINNYLQEALKKPKNKLELTNAIKNKIIIVSDYLADVNESLEMINIMINFIDDEIDVLEN
jgi:hypothetical protein